MRRAFFVFIYTATQVDCTPVFMKHFKRFFLLALLTAISQACAQGRGTAPAGVALPVLQQELGTTNYTWDGTSLTITNTTHQLRFFAGRRRTDVNGTIVWLNTPPQGSVTSGNWSMASIDFDLLRYSVLPPRGNTTKPLRVMLDPGHGGDDDGAVWTNPLMHEKHLTLAIAQKVGKLLQDAGMTVLYTRTNDVSVSLGDRSQKARKDKADIFISIHINYASNLEASGLETFILPSRGFGGTHASRAITGWLPGTGNDFHNTMLGYSIQSELMQLSNCVDRGLKRQAFFVLRETRCPAVLVELGFLSNKTDRKRLTNTRWQNNYARAIANGIKNYAGGVDRLNVAMTRRRKEQEEANERWRKHLLAKSSATQKVDKVTTVVSNTPVAEKIQLMAREAQPGNSREQEDGRGRPEPEIKISNSIVTGEEE